MGCDVVDDTDTFQTTFTCVFYCVWELMLLPTLNIIILWVLIILTLILILVIYFIDKTTYIDSILKGFSSTSAWYCRCIGINSLRNMSSYCSTCIILLIVIIIGLLLLRLADVIQCSAVVLGYDLVTSSIIVPVCLWSKLNISCYWS